MLGMPSLAERIAKIAAPFQRYERHFAAAGMVAGFAIDSVTFGRLDRPGAHLIFGSCLVVAALTIAMSHRLQTQTDARRLNLPSGGDPKKARGTKRDKAAHAPLDEGETAAATDNGTNDASEQKQEARWKRYLPAVTQFALGGLWSGFLVFYSRSASVAASWPFLLVLTAFLVGNEIFRKYHERLVFASLLFFFAAYSYSVFTVPLVTRTIGRMTFLLSGAVAVAAFLVFLDVLSAVGRARYRQSRWWILGGAAVITAAMNVFYFTGVLPPIPLALTKIGAYHAIKHKGQIYLAEAEREPWYTNYGIGRPVLHVAAGEPLSLYSAVFAPIQLSTFITHRWQRYNGKQWISESVVRFPINGGRAEGYRAYTIKKNPEPGEWRVDIRSDDNRLIGRLTFDVVRVSAAVKTKMVTIK
jgi:DUF2914 family protein